MPSRARSSLRTSAVLAERVRAILNGKELTLYRVSRESARVYGRSSPFFLPHNFYYDLRTGAFRPSIHQVVALSRISGYRVADWLRVFGYNLEDITRFQVLLSRKRTVVLDTTLTDINEFVPWLENRSDETRIPSIAPLGRLLNQASAQRIGSVQGSGPRRFLYARIGRDDVLAFPELVPGSIVRVNPEAVTVTRRDNSQISDRIFLVEHSKGFCCSRIRVLGTNTIALFDNGLRFAQVELRCPEEARLCGAVDFEFRPLLQAEEPVVRKDLARHWKPQPLPAHESFGQLLKRTRRTKNLSLREAAQMSRAIAGILKDNRYITSSSSLSDYELHHTAPRDFHKIVALCSVYGLEFESVMRRIGVDLADTGTETMPDPYLSRTSCAAIAEKADTGNIRSGFLEKLVHECQEIPFCLRHSLGHFFGSARVSLDDFFWVGGDDDPLHPYLKNSLIVMVNRRRKTPVHFLSKDLWQQPIYIVLKRDGTYLASCCRIEHGRLVVHAYTRDFRRDEQLRLHQDAEVVGQIVAIARRLF